MRCPRSLTLIYISQPTVNLVSSHVLLKVTEPPVMLSGDLTVFVGLDKEDTR